ncbi:MAG: GxxExxY protein [Planctomycetota bacterium]|jgi:GxxExxY protein
MSRDADLLFAILALQLGFITKEQLIECGALWASEKKTPLPDILSEKGFLTPEARSALDGLVAAKVEQSGDVADSLASLSLDDDTASSLLALPLEGEALRKVGDLGKTPAGPDETRIIEEPGEDRYEPGDEIGRGGLGRVRAAQDRILDREVAIKEMVKGTDVPRLLKRFLREGQIAGRLTHPNVIPVHDIGFRVGHEGKTPYFVMTRIRGRDLQAILKEILEGEASTAKEFTRPRLLGLFQDVCLAVAYAHDHGVIHRDLKPANVMVGDYGEVYVVDWGLATVKGGEPDFPDAPSEQTDLPDSDLPDQEQKPEQKGYVDERYKHSEITAEILTCYFKVFNKLGPGHKEKVYERAILYELKKVFSNVTSQEQLAVRYEEIVAGVYCPDILVEEKVLVELKSKRALVPDDEKQLLYYLSATKIEVGLVLNFGRKKPDFRRRFVSSSPDNKVRDQANQFDAKRHQGVQSLTVDGEILGTPSYMPPEQAQGNTEAIDERSDVYSLGAILYEILTFEPPYMGQTGLHIVAQVIGEPLVPPSRRLEEAREEAGADSKTLREPFLPEPIPPELEEIVLRAMARDKEDRYGSARELNEEVQSFLEGEKERERKSAEAVERVRAGARHLSRFRSLEKEIEEQRRVVDKVGDDVRTWAPLEEKKRLWKEEDRVVELREERMEEFGKAEIAFGQAIEADPTNPDGMEGKAALYYERFLAAEKRRDRDEMGLNRNLLGEYDRPRKWLRRIERPGTLTLRTFAPQCACLRPRAAGTLRVEFGEDVTVVWREGRPVPGEAVTEEDRPVPEIRVHSEGGEGFARMGHEADCPREALPGVEVLAHRYQEKDRHLVLGPEKALGRTPLEAVTLDRGSYLCRLRHPGFREVRLPVRIDRGGAWEQEVNLYAEKVVPGGFCQVSDGPFLEGGDERHGGEFSEKRTLDFFVARYPVTVGEYLVFLNHLAETDPDAARARQPREADMKFLVEGEGRWRTPEDGEENPLNVSDELPVFGVSWFDALAYCAWRSAREGFLFTLPHEEEFEKASRGVDGRRYPWGDATDNVFSNTLYSFAEGGRLLKPGSFPVDESPYGVVDLAGNMPAWCLNSPEIQFQRDRLIRGGAWCFTSDRSAASHRVGLEPQTAYRHTGFRLVLRPLG